MSLIHALVARGSIILAEHQAGEQDFSQATAAILSKIPPNNSKLTYVWEQYLFHYVSENGITYLVMAEEAAERRMPFAFLTELQRKFTSLPSTSTTEPSPLPHSLQGTFGPTIAALVTAFNTREHPASTVAGGSSQALAAAQTELDAVKSIMVQNVESILSRGERIELLVDKTDNMASQATAFRRGARSVRRQMWWRNTKVVALSGVVALIILWLLVAQFCGAGLNQCGSKP